MPTNSAIFNCLRSGTGSTSPSCTQAESAQSWRWKKARRAPAFSRKPFVRGGSSSLSESSKSKGRASDPAFSFECFARVLVRGDCLCCRRLFHRSHLAFHGLLHLFERPHFDLSYALARDTELGCQFLERDRIVSQSSCLEDAPLAFVQNVQRRDQRLVPIVALFTLGKDAFLTWCLIN